MFLKVTFTDGTTDAASLTVDTALHVVGPDGVEKAWSLATVAGVELVADVEPAPAVVQPNPEPEPEPVPVVVETPTDGPQLEPEPEPVVPVVPEPVPVVEPEVVEEPPTQ